MSIRIRPAAAAEQAIIKQIVRDARINPMQLDWHRFLVAEDNGQIVGIGQAKPHRDGSRELASIAVVPSHQRRGVAAQIIQALIARENGDLYLVCRTPLEMFYTRFGFRRVGRDEMTPAFRRWYRFVEFFRQTHSVIVMRRLGE